MDPALAQALVDNARVRRRAAWLRVRASNTRTHTTATLVGLEFKRWARLAQLAAGSSEDDARLSRDGSQDSLAILARGAIAARLIPAAAGDRSWGSRGRGVSCAVCGEPISPDQTDIAVEFASNGGSPKIEVVHLHIRCCCAWDAERMDRDGSRL